MGNRCGIGYAYFQRVVSLTITSMTNKSSSRSLYAFALFRKLKKEIRWEKGSEKKPDASFHCAERVPWYDFPGK